MASLTNMTSRGPAIPRYRQYEGPALLREGFRPFFLAAGLWSALAMAIWGWQFGHGLMLPTAFGWAGWHAHEMVFGYLFAALAGFLLTAVPNWTGRMPLQGAPLAALSALWLVGRLAVLTSAVIGPWTAMVLDLAFPAALLAVLAREVVAGRNWRNLPVCICVGVLLAACALDHASLVSGLPPRTGLRLAIATFAMLIALVGGRIVPSFTRNWLAKRGAERMPAKHGWLDRATLGATAIAGLAWTIAPSADATAGLAGAAALANLARMMRWRGHATWREPLLLVLHVGYAWLVVGFAALALAPVVSGLTATAALHALTAGAMGTMPLAVMTRATLGHTGRALHADVPTTLCFVLVVLAAVLRTVATAIPDWTLALYGLAVLGWLAAFTIFLVVYAPKLLRSSR